MIGETSRLTFPICLALLLCGPAEAFDLTGQGQVFWGSTDSLAGDSSTTDQKYSFNIRQELSAFLSLALAYDHSDFTTALAEGPAARQRRRSPAFDLRYRRPGLSAAAQWERSRTDGSLSSGAFDVNRFATNFFWEPGGGFSLTARYDDTENVADVGALGRNTEQQNSVIQARYQRRFVTGSYLFQRSEIANPDNEFSSKQDRHQGRVVAGRSFFGQLVRLGFNGSISNLESRQVVGPGADLAEPLPAAQGLFAVNLTPEIGDLEPLPALIDGDVTTPAAGVDIGGAKTFRNIGVDLGIVRPITRLEVSVDRPSAANLVWAVFRSADNVLWEEVPGSRSAFDGGLLRYYVDFPESEERFFKVVNVSANAEPIVLVSEIRALRAIDASAGSAASERRLYSVNASARLRTPGGLADFQMTAGRRNDESLTEGLTRRDYYQSYSTARLNLRLASTVAARAYYRLAESDNRAGSELFRQSETAGSGLSWNPLRTVRADVLVQRREESSEKAALRTTDSMTLSLLTELLPDLDLTSRLMYSRLSMPGSESERESWTWSESLRTRPLPRLRVDGHVSYSRISSEIDGREIDRSSTRLASVWSATAFLSLRGEAIWTDNDGLEGLHQLFSLGYAPGSKLNLALNFDRSTSDGGRSTSASSAGFQYDLREMLHLVGSISMTETSIDGDVTTRNDSMRVGFYFSI